MKIKSKYRPELICSKDQTRRAITEPHLGRVKGKLCLSATDGRKLVVFPVEADNSECGTVLKDALRLARSTQVDKRQDTINLNLNGNIELPNGWTLPRPQQGEFNYPNVDSVIPDEKGQSSVVSFDVRQLRDIALSMGVNHVVLKFQDSMSAITVTSPNEEAYAVLMPMRVS